MNRVIYFIACIFFLSFATEALAGPWDNVVDSTTGAVKKVGSAVGDTAGVVGESVGDSYKRITDKETPAEARQKADGMAEEALTRLFKEDKSAKGLYDKSYGYAVFDSRKFSFLLTTGAGGGVAVDKDSRKRTYMRMLTGGANVGMGAQFFQLVFLFEDKGSFDSFVNKGWEAAGEAAAVFGEDAIDAQARFVEGKAIYRLTETGIMLGLNLAGTKYYKDKKLNEG